MKLKFIIIFLIVSFTMRSQQDAQYTHYMYNTTHINPAYAGSKEAISIFGLYRTQWVGLDGAPKTSTLSLNTPIGEHNLGLGASFINESIGPSATNNLAIDLSYKIQVTENYKLAFGIKASGALFQLDVSKLKQNESQDLNSISNEFLPNIGAGLYLFSEKGYFGLSVPQFIQNKTYDEKDIALYQQKINTYLIGGYVFDLNQDIKFKPAFISKVVAGSPLQIDVSGNFLFYEKFTIGLAYRWSAAVSALVAFQISNSLMLGYGYDLETTVLRKYNSGSHEIYLRYEVFRPSNKIITPRFF